MDNSITVYVVSILAFVGGVALFEGVVLLIRSLKVRETVRINRRLKNLSAGGGHGSDYISLLQQKQLSDSPVLNRIFMAIPRLHVLDRNLEQAGVDMTVSSYLLLQLAISLVAIILFGLLSPISIVYYIPAGLLVGFIIPSMYLSSKKKKRQEKFTMQMPEAMDFIARSMRAGNPFSTSLHAVSQEFADPVGTEFGITFDEINFGLELEDALLNLSERTGNEDIRYFITAVLIQRSTGGNLADIMNRIAVVLRARASMFREISILSSEMRMSANVLIGLPFVVALAISVTNPGYLTTLTDSTLGLMVIAAQVILMLIGYMVIRKMINFRV